MKILSDLANVCEGLVLWPVCLVRLWASLKRLLSPFGAKLGKLLGVVNVQADCVGFRTSSQAFLVALSVFKISLKSLIEI